LRGVRRRPLPADVHGHGRQHQPRRPPHRARRDAAAAGRGGRLTVVGPAGIGKSRLLAEALADSHLPVLRADGDRYAANTPYRTVQTLLRPLLGIPAEAGAAEAGPLLTEAVCRVRADLEPWVPLLAPTVGAEVPTTPQVA